MDRWGERMAEAMAAKVGRRGFVACVFRSAVTIGIAAAGVFGADRHALASNPPPQCIDAYGTGNTCGMPPGWCGDNTSNNGCGGLPNCSSAYGTAGSSNCQGGYVSFGYWDCCCGNNLWRCRDCGPSGGSAQCICSANIGSC